jgi:integrase
MYMIAQRTGLRRGELRTLTPSSFGLDESPPIVVVSGADSKRRKKDVLPLSANLARTVYSYLETRDQKNLIWPGSWWRRSAEMLRNDLEESGIDPIAEDGRVVDFHGQRVTFITGLARAGVHPAVAQKLARHSDVNLTLKTYTRLQLTELLNAVESLPSLEEVQSATLINEKAESGDVTSSDPRLRQIQESWNNLSEKIRNAIVALVQIDLPTDPNDEATP